MGSLDDFSDLRLPDGWVPLPVLDRQVSSGRERTSESWYRLGHEGTIADAHVDSSGYLSFRLVASSGHSPALQAFEGVVGGVAKGGLPEFHHDKIAPPLAWTFYFEPGVLDADR
jgi:hypothetical protein